MPYTLTRKANHIIEVSAHLDAETVTQQKTDIVRGIQRRASIPGFRAGKAPAAAVRARFSEQINEDLRDHLTGILWQEVLEEEGDLEPLTNPTVSDLEFADDGTFRFTAEIEVRPRYDLPELEHLDLPEIPLEVGDDEVDVELDRLRDEHAVWEPADDESAIDGMLVEADLHGVMDASDQDPYDEKDARFVLGTDGVPNEVNETLQGARVGDQRIAEKRFPDDDENPDRAGKVVRYTIDVKGLKKKTLPEIDDDLAAGLGLDSLEALRERIVEALTSQKRGQRRTKWRRFVLDHLEEGLDQGDLPPTLVQATVRENIQRFAYTMTLQGMAPDSADIDWQELAAKAEPPARLEVLDTLVLEQLAEIWAVEVPETDVDAYIASEAAQLGVPPAEHKANLAAENKLDRIRHGARISATVDEMIRRAGGEVV